MQNPWDQTVGVLTGAVGDYLARSGNALAMPMTLAQDGEPLEATPEALRAAYAQPASRLVLLVHGLMATELAFAFGQVQSHTDYGTQLEARGWSALRVRYNSGLAVAPNALELAQLLEQVVQAWPVQVTEIALIGHSMGGLVVRGACAVATETKLTWPTLVRHVACLGTPHCGAPLERGGRWAVEVLQQLPDPVANLLGQWAQARSEGIQQLAAAATTFWLADARHLLLASSLAGETPLAPLVGDGMVSLTSALAQGEGLPEAPNVDRKVLQGLHHATLAFAPQVGEVLVQWLPQFDLPLQQESSLGSESATAAPKRKSPQGIAGIVQLAGDAVRHGHRGVAQVRLARADQVLAVVNAVLPMASGPAKIVHALHEGLVAVQHAAIETGVAVVEGVATAAVASNAGARDPTN
ncbi:MAG: hypothetical protein EXR77_11955 [Myxococcales bacterium]|nr:hypothetical protein [Myxococcales bacterium]